MLSEHQTSLYRYYDKNGILLYVGITSRGMQRNREHSATKEWWPFVTRQEVDHYQTRTEAEVAEKAHIITHRPPFNIQHNPDHALMRAAYLETGRTVTLQAQLIWLKRYVPAELLDHAGLRRLYVTPGKYRTIVELFDRDSYGFKVGSMRNGRAKLNREDGAFFVTVTGEGPIAPPVIGLRFDYVKQKPVVLTAGAVTLDYQRTAQCKELSGRARNPITSKE